MSLFEVRIWKLRPLSVQTLMATATGALSVHWNSRNLYSRSPLQAESLCRGYKHNYTNTIMSSVDVSVTGLSFIDRISGWLADAPGQPSNPTQEDEQPAFEPSSYGTDLSLRPTQSPTAPNHSNQAEVGLALIRPDTPSLCYVSRN